MTSPILYQDDFSSVTILDIPRSLEQAQGKFFRQKIISSAPLQKSYPSVEPQSEKARANLVIPSISELLLEKHIELVLQEVRKNYQGSWCLPRNTDPTEDEDLQHDESRELHPRKRQKINHGHEEIEASQKKKLKTETDGPLYQNDGVLSTYLDLPGGSRIHLPPNSTGLQEDISETLDLFRKKAPKFNLILLDPPWPNRSARRKGSYELSYSSTDIRTLLFSLPVENHLDDAGLVGVWITNKPVFREMLLAEGGLFDDWGLEFAEEWIWLKVTEFGEPVCALNSAWRKPYEILLVGRKKPLFSKSSTKERSTHLDEGIVRRVIIGVPDLHSRKPNLKAVFGKVVGKGNFKSLEIFARNMTEGWWAWGNEVLKFQGEEHWVPTKAAS